MQQDEKSYVNSGPMIAYVNYINWKRPQKTAENNADEAFRLHWQSGLLLGKCHSCQYIDIATFLLNRDQD